MLKRLLFLGLSIASGVLIVVVLYAMYESAKHSSNGFVRLMPSHAIKGLGFKNVKYNSWRIGEITVDKIVLTNSNPGYLMLLDTALKDTLVQKLVWPDTLKVFKGAMTGIVAPYVYLQDAAVGTITSGKLKEFAVRYRYPVPMFTACVRLSPTSFIFRSIKGGKESILMKQTGMKLVYDTTTLQKQIDGMFCTDGSLIRVPETDKLVYIYNYRNQFMVLDTNLHLLYRAETLDTISRAQIKVAEMKDQHKLTMSAPPVFVNKQVAANRDYLFIQSARKADNDVNEVWESNTVLDVYALKDGKYKLSLYVPHFKDIKPKDFKVFGNKLLVLYDNYLYRYEINMNALIN